MSFPKLLEERNLMLQNMEAVVNKAKQEKRSLSNVEVAQFDQWKERIQAIDTEMKGQELVETRNFKPVKNGKEQEQVAQEERAFIDFIVHGENRDLASTNNGSVIPTSIASKIVDKVFEISPLIQEATVYNVGENLNLPVYDYSAHVTSFLTEFTDIVESGGTFTSVPLTSKIIGTMTKVGKSLVNRTDLEVLPFIINACAKSVAKFLENEIILNTNAKFASTLATGVTQTITTGTTLVIDPSELIRMKNAIPSMMLPNAKWLMHKDTLSYIQSLKATTGELLFGNSLSEANAPMILGHEVMLSDAMPKVGVGARQIYFGDFKEGLAIKIGAQSAEVYRELYAKQYALGVGHFIEADVSASHSQQSLVAMVGK